ncbi:MAG: TadE family protein [Thermomicrobiaceae bacterium]
MFQGNHASKSRGQSLVELAVMLPIAVMMLALSADFGRAMTAYIQVGSAAREGAAYGMQSTEASEDTSAMIDAVRAETTTIWGDPIAVSFPVCSAETLNRPNGDSYNCVAVTVSYNFRPLIPIWPIPSVIPMERTVEMRVVN